MSKNVLFVGWYLFIHDQKICQDIHTKTSSYNKILIKSIRFFKLYELFVDFQYDFTKIMCLQKLEILSISIKNFLIFTPAR